MNNTQGSNGAKASGNAKGSSNTQYSSNVQYSSSAQGSSNAQRSSNAQGFNNTQGSNRSVPSTNARDEKGPSAGQTSNSNSGPSSKYSMIKEGRGSRSNFQHSYGLKMDPEGFEEGNAILEKFQEYDARK